MKRYAAFSLIQLLFVISIMAIIAALMWPVFSKARDEVRQVGCANNLRQVYVAASLYATDNGSLIVPALVYTSATVAVGNVWQSYLSGYLPVDTQELACPAVPSGPGVDLDTTIGENPYLDNCYGYGQLLNKGKMNNVGNLARQFLFADCNNYATFSWLPPVYRHHGGANFCFLDGHIEWLHGPIAAAPQASNNNVVVPPW